MFCPNCGANIPEEVRICPECGTEIIVPRRSDDEHDRFIVAEDTREVHTPFGQVTPVQEGQKVTPRLGIIEADEEPLPEETGDVLLGASSDDTDEHIHLKGDVRFSGSGTGQDRTNDIHAAPVFDNGDVHTEREGDPSLSGTVPADLPISGSSSGSSARDEVSGGTKPESRSADSDPYIDLPSSSRKRSVIAGMAVMIFVVLGLAILVYGLPGQGPVDTGVSVPTPLPTPLPTALPEGTPVPVTDTPPWTPSENLYLSISAYDGGYKVEIDGGLKANEVETIVMTVEDMGGIHTMEWVYPSRRESFFMAREAYNGTASATESVTATATFTDGKKEVVFSKDL